MMATYAFFAITFFSTYIFLRLTEQRGGLKEKIGEKKICHYMYAHLGENGDFYRIVTFTAADVAFLSCKLPFYCLFETKLGLPYL